MDAETLVKFKVGDLVEFKSSYTYCDRVFLIKKKSDWAYHLQCLSEVSHVSVRFDELKRLKLATNKRIKLYISDWLKNCLINNYTKGL